MQFRQLRHVFNKAGLVDWVAFLYIIGLDNLR